MGGFVLTGSAQFDLIAGITQSLAGRVGRIALSPLTADELAAAGKLPSTLQASCLVARLPAYHRNFGKRLVKAPKLYFCDAGLAAWLLGIRDATSLDTHAARGALFETYVVSELMKQRLNAGQPRDLYFWRDSAGNEVDVVIESAQGLQAIEIKSGSTFASDWTDGLKKWQKFAGDESIQPSLVYGGTDSHEREGVQVWGWPALGKLNPLR
jgi:predicted AAA+ superfamily ATPase